VVGAKKRSSPVAVFGGTVAVSGAAFASFAERNGAVGTGGSINNVPQRRHVGRIADTIVPQPGQVFVALVVDMAQLLRQFTLRTG
jgi:hypothetical protein